MDQKTFNDVYDTLPVKRTELKSELVELRVQVVELNRQLENYKLIASYAQDVLDFWPTMTMRTIRTMIPKMNSLAEALKLIG